MRVLVVCLVVAVACLATPGWGRHVRKEGSSDTAIAYPSPLRNNLKERMMIDREFVAELDMALSDDLDSDESDPSDEYDLSEEEPLSLEVRSEEELLPAEDELELERERRFFGWIKDIWKKVKAGVKKVTNVVVGGVKKVGNFLSSDYTNLKPKASEGLKYTINKLTHSRDKEQGAETLERLEGALAQGDGRVSDFFGIIGAKIKTWLGSLFGRKRGLDDSKMPNFFKDRDVQEEVKKLVQSGVITRKEAETLIEDPVD